MQGWGVNMVAGLGIFAGWFLACAGQDTPPVDDDLRGAIAQGFGGGDTQMGTAGSGNGGRGGGNAGSANAGSANAGSSSAGSANNGGGNGGGAGGGGEPVGGGGGGDICPAFDTIILERCGSAGCHNEGASIGEFGASEELAATFVDEPGSACDDLIINSANPEESLLYTKLFDPIPAGCGNLQMPLSGDLLTEEESDCVLSWLQQFAE